MMELGMTCHEQMVIIRFGIDLALYDEEVTVIVGT
jgi:hypothetical protein